MRQAEGKNLGCCREEDCRTGKCHGAHHCRAGKVIPGSLNPPGAWAAAQIDTHWPDIAPECVLTFIP